MLSLSFFDIKKPKALAAQSLDELSGIGKPYTNLAYYKRPVDEDIHLFVKTLIDRDFRGFDAVVSSHSIKEVVANELDKVAVHTSGKIGLAEDIANLTQLFLSITRQEHTHLYLKLVSDDACRKFHTDRYDLRLLCTYVGAGTEWIEDRYVNRNKLVGGDNESIIKDASKIKTMQPFEVGILKGEASLQNKGKGIVHRSPPIQHKNEKRLLLRLDY